ncbi:pyruvate dehydrogenase (acetyl-transferring), homodimeric type [Guyparkeria sp. 1SP6A2]|nr:pyruvate dehydrogenase (acetyl-transferring), homodimeric type [Guyparkeria sp. 1SP6A2]
MTDYNDQDPQETREWLDALEAVVNFEGTEKARHLIASMIERARQHGIDTPYSATTPYINTIPPENEAQYPGDRQMEQRLRALIRWNAMAIVVRANKDSSVGGHIASYQSSATMYEVGLNHFFKGHDHPEGSDMVFFQGHVSPGMYARAYLEGRISEEQLLNFRQEAAHEQALSSYPHPWLMPDFWQFPTVSMGLGPLMAIYQARFMKYMEARGFGKVNSRKVYAFLGDGEMDEPESLGAIGLAVREKLDNLVFVVNANLQRLDGPVRGNGKIIQELEGSFRGAGWNVVKVIWGPGWDELLARDKSGKLMELMMETVDGEYQAFKAKDGAFVRKQFFGKYPETAELVKNMTDDEIFSLTRGGHSPRKMYAAYKAANECKGKPTVIIAKTVKGYGMGPFGEGAMTAHQQKKLDNEGLKYFRDRFGLPISDEQLEKNVPFYKPDDSHELIKYMNERRTELGGYLPSRVDRAESLPAPDLSAFDMILKGTGEREMSSTMLFGRILAMILRDKKLGKRVVPIIPDEARTFGLEGLFRQVGIYDPAGQLYEPVDADQVAWYKQAANGQVLQEGINEAGSMSSWLAAATAYANYGEAMVPFYIYYSMFGYQRVGDLAWLAGDIRARGFLIGATAGRTTLEGEGLQHNDGHNIMMFSAVPSCRVFDPTYGYEMAIIIRDGLKAMVEEKQDCYYYITSMNENYSHPAMPEDVEEGVLKGAYRLRESKKKLKNRVQLMGSGTILREAEAAARMLEDEWKVAADVWSATSFTELAREGQACERHNRLHPEAEPKKPYITAALEEGSGPIIAATDYIQAYPDQIRRFVPGSFTTLGTDGYGRSDNRAALRRFFEVDSAHIVVAALQALANEGSLPASKVSEALEKYGIDTECGPPIER